MLLPWVGCCSPASATQREVCGPSAGLEPKAVNAVPLSSRRVGGAAGSADALERHGTGVSEQGHGNFHGRSGQASEGMEKSSLTHSRSLLSESGPSTLMFSKSSGSLDHGLSRSFLSGSSDRGDREPPREQPRARYSRQTTPPATRSVEVQTESLTLPLCSRCGRPPQPPQQPPSPTARPPHGSDRGQSASPDTRGPTGAARGAFSRLSRLTAGIPVRRRGASSRRSSRCLLSQFAETPKRTVMMCLLDAIEKVNPRGEGCCPYHVALAGVAKVLQEMGVQDCIPDFSPLLDWQCPGCFALNGATPRFRHRSENSDEDQEEDAAPHCEVCGVVAPPLYSSSAGSTMARSDEADQYWNAVEGQSPGMWNGGGWETGVTTGSGSSYHHWRQPQRPAPSRPSDRPSPEQLRQPTPQHRPVAAELLRDLEEAAAAEMQPDRGKKSSRGSPNHSSSSGAGRQTSGSTDSTSSAAGSQRRRQAWEDNASPDDGGEEIRQLMAPVGSAVAAGADPFEGHRPRSPAPALIMPEAVRAAGTRRRSTNSPPSSTRSGHAADCAAGRSARHTRNR